MTRGGAEQLILHATDLAVRQRDPHGAAELINSGLHNVPPKTAHILRSARAVQLADSGHPQKAVAVLDRVDQTEIGGIARAYYWQALTQALSEFGQFDRTLVAASRGLSIEAAVPTHQCRIRIVEFAIGAANSGHQANLARAFIADHQDRWRDGSPLGESAAVALTALADLAAGEPATAAVALDRALEGLDGLGESSGLRYRFTLASAEALARCGHTAAAVQRVDEFDAVRHPAFAYALPNEFVSRAWASATAGDLATAGALALQGADIARQRGQLRRELTSLDAAVQFGATSVAARRAALTSRFRGYPRMSEIVAPEAILARAFITLPGMPPPTTPTSTPSRS